MNSKMTSNSKILYGNTHKDGTIKPWIGQQLGNCVLNDDGSSGIACDQCCRRRNIRAADIKKGRECLNHKDYNDMAISWHCHKPDCYGTCWSTGSCID